MGEFYSTYKRDATGESEVTIEAGECAVQIVRRVPTRLTGLDLFMKRSAAAIIPALVKIAATSEGESSASVEVSSASMTTDSFSRVHVPLDIVCASWQLIEIRVTAPSVGALYVKGIVPPPDRALLTDIVIEGESGNMTVTDTSFALTLYDDSTETSLTSAPIDFGSGIYAPGGTRARWVFDGVLLPLPPESVSIRCASECVTEKLLLARKITLAEKESTSPRVRYGYTATLTFGKVGRDLAAHFKTYEEFALPFYAELPVMDASSPEVLYTEDKKTYWGTLSMWKTGSTSVYLDGTKIETGFTIDTRAGSVTFDSEQAAGAIVQASYTWRPRMRLALEANLSAGGGDTWARPIVTLTEVEDA
jgi:hypothetical protein